jgi:hypothetical protein
MNQKPVMFREIHYVQKSNNIKDNFIGADFGHCPEPGIFQRH